MYKLSNILEDIRYEVLEKFSLDYDIDKPFYMLLNFLQSEEVTNFFHPRTFLFQSPPFFPHYFSKIPYFAWIILFY